MAAAPDETSQPVVPRRPSPWRRTWLSPGGVSAIAAVVTLLIGVVTFVVQQGTPTQQPTTPSVSVTPGAEQPSLFVYGTSMPGMTRYGAISQYVTGSARDAVAGLLYDSGLGYPLAKFGPGGDVRDFVLSLDADTADAAMAELTRVEAGLFHPVKVRTRSGVTAYAYEYLGATDNLPRIDVWDGSTAHYGQAAA